MLGAYKQGDELDTARVNQNRRWTGLMVRKVLGGELVGDYIDANLDVPDEDVRPRDGDALPRPNANMGTLRLVDIKEEARAAESASASRPRGSTDTLAVDADVQPRKRPRVFQFRSSQGVASQGVIDLDDDPVDVPNPCDLDADTGCHNDEHLALEDLMEGMMLDENSDVMGAGSD